MGLVGGSPPGPAPYAPPQPPPLTHVLGSDLAALAFPRATSWTLANPTHCQSPLVIFEKPHLLTQQWGTQGPDAPRSPTPAITHRHAHLDGGQLGSQARGGRGCRVWEAPSWGGVQQEGPWPSMGRVEMR